MQDPQHAAPVPAPVTFCFNSHEVRTLIKDGEPWFLARDVTDILGYKDSAGAVRKHCKSPFLFNSAIPHELTSSPFGATIIPERDVYRLIMKSKLPGAVQFEEWVVAEVLPSLRRNGSYSVSDSPAIPQTLSQALRLAADLEDQKLALEHKVEVLEPKAAITDRIAQAHGSLCVTDAAKALQVQPSFLFSLLETAKWVYRRMGLPDRVAYQDKIQAGLLEHKVVPIVKRDGTEITQTQVRVTPNGLVKLATLVGGAA